MKLKEMIIKVGAVIAMVGICSGWSPMMIQAETETVQAETETVQAESETVQAESEPMKANYSGFFYGNGWGAVNDDNTLCVAPVGSYLTAMKASLVNQPEPLKFT